MPDTPRLEVVTNWSKTPPPVAESMRQQGLGYDKPFGPGEPLTPFQGYRGEPRAWNYQTGYNIATRPLRDGRVSFDTLRTIVNSWDIARICIAHRIDDIRSLDWAVVAADGVEDDVSTAIQYGTAKMEFPEGPGSDVPFESWLAAWLEDILRYDAGTLYRVRNREGKVCGLETVSGTSVAPLVDYWGRKPRPPAEAYAQFIQGTPWKWFTTDDIIYLPFRAQSDSPYGWAPLESILMAANTDLRMQAYFLQYFTSGNVPEGFATAPQDLSSPDQIREWQQWWDAMLYGDQEAKHQLRWVPYGTDFKWSKDSKFDEQFNMFMMGKAAAAFSVNLNDLGFVRDVNRANGETQTEVQFRIGTLPLLKHVQGILTRYLRKDLGLPVKFQFDAGQEKDDRLQEAQTHKAYVDMGAESPDEVRQNILGLPVDQERPVGRFVNHPRRGPIPLLDVVSGSGIIDPETYGPAKEQPELPGPSVAIPSIVPDQVTSLGDATDKTLDQEERARLAELHPGSAYLQEPVKASETAGVTAQTGIVGYDLDGEDLKDAVRKAILRVTGARVRKDTPTVAGLAVKADDTGRVLLLQRALTGDDPAGGCWELPGGHLEPGEEPLMGACREWAEEVGCPPPAGVLAGSWDSGIYRGHVWVIPSETDLSINLGPGDRSWTNPDDPDGDAIETVAWWDPQDLPGMPSLRPELAASTDDWLPVVTAASLPDADTVREEMRAWRRRSRQRVSAHLYPIRFDRVLPTRIVDQVWETLKDARTPSDVDAAFRRVVKAGKGQWRDGAARVPQHAYDLAITDHYTPILAGALGQLWTDTAIRDAARDIGALPPPNPGPLREILESLWADAWATGRHAAEQQADRVRKDADIDWDTWEPGNLTAAVLASDGGFAAALADAGITISGITDTAAQKLGRILTEGLLAGDSVDTITRSIRDALGGNLSWAEAIAHTETSRFQALATLDTYRANGIGMWDWILSDGACPKCVAGAEAGPYPTTEVILPLHVRCRCASAPVPSSVG